MLPTILVGRLQLPLFVKPFEFALGGATGFVAVLGPHKHQAKFTHLNFVATNKHSRLHRLPVHEGAVEATHVNNVEFVRSRV